MPLYIVRYNPQETGLFTDYSRAVSSAGDYWSLTTQREPVTISEVASTIYDNEDDIIRACSLAIKFGLPWKNDPEKLVWIDGHMPDD